MFLHAIAGHPEHLDGRHPGQPETISYAGVQKLIVHSQFPIRRQRVRAITIDAKPDGKIVFDYDIENVLEGGMRFVFLGRFTRIQDDAMFLGQLPKRAIQFLERYVFSVKRHLAGFVQVDLCIRSVSGRRFQFVLG
jgi:hypothetical protein